MIFGILVGKMRYNYTLQMNDRRGVPPPADPSRKGLATVLDNSTADSACPKICRKCGALKLIHSFSVVTRNRDGHDTACRDCRRAQYSPEKRKARTASDTRRNIRRVLLRDSPIAPDHRRCCRCHEIKTLVEFPNSRGHAKGKAHRCLICSRDVAKAWAAEYAPRLRERRERQRDAYLETNWRWRQNLKDRVFAAYWGYRCACCGEMEPFFLAIDHVNNDGAAHRKSGVGRNLYLWLEKNGYPEGFQVLCHNCNIGKHQNGGICPHQQQREAS